MRRGFWFKGTLVCPRPALSPPAFPKIFSGKTAPFCPLPPAFPLEMGPGLNLLSWRLVPSGQILAPSRPASAHP